MIVYIDTKGKQYLGEIYNPFENLNIEQVRELIGIPHSDKVGFTATAKKLLHMSGTISSTRLCSS